jgi:hypothetical protein
MTRFVQVIEFRTSRIDEMQDLVEELRAGAGTGSALRGMVTKDRDRPGWYLNIVEFDSYEAAMSNSARSEVSAFAARMATLCDEPPRFYNLDLVESWDDQGTSTSTRAAAVSSTSTPYPTPVVVESQAAGDTRYTAPRPVSPPMS